MLTLTENAVAVIRNLTDQQEAPDGAGLRIATDQSAGALTLSLAPEPQEGDQVVDTFGARLFLDSDAATLLDDKELDAAVDPQGAVQFAVAEIDEEAGDQGGQNNQANQNNQNNGRVQGDQR